MNQQVLLLNLFLLSIITNIIIAVYGFIWRPNLVKKIIALTIINDSVCVLLVYTGYRTVNPVPPVHKIPYNISYSRELLVRSVDPLVQAFVLTAIVIGLAFTIFLSVMALRIYELSGTVNIHKLLSIEVFEREVEVVEE